MCFISSKPMRLSATFPVFVYCMHFANIHTHPPPPPHKHTYTHTPTHTTHTHIHTRTQTRAHTHTHIHTYTHTHANMQTCILQRAGKSAKKVVETDEWRKKSVEERLIYSLMKVRTYLYRTVCNNMHVRLGD